jgi:hypothetical protein
MKLNELKFPLYISRTPFLKARRRQDMDMSPLCVPLNVRLRPSVILWALDAVIKPLLNATMFFDSVQEGAPDVMYQLMLIILTRIRPISAFEFIAMSRANIIN